MPDPISNAAPPAAHTLDPEPIVVTGKLHEITSPVSHDDGPPLSELAMQCLPKLDGVVIAVAGAALGNPVIAALGSFKAGFELAECIDEQQEKAGVQAAIDRGVAECEAMGGAPTGAFPITYYGEKAIEVTCLEFADEQ